MQKNKAKNETDLKERGAQDGSGEWFPVPDITSYKQSKDCALGTDG